MTICIISHTEHYKDKHGNIVGWGSTVREINHLLEIADRIIHLAPLHAEKPPVSSLAYCDDRIQFVPLKPSGGKGLKKLSILFTAIHNLKQIHKYTKKADYIQFRAPTGMGLYVLPYLRFFRNKKYWVKYAGNWVDRNMPMGNLLQKLFLLNCISKFTKVTYNGNWVKKSNFLSFENPCLSSEDYMEGKKHITKKEFVIKHKLRLCFVGNLTENKGIIQLLDAFSSYHFKEHTVIDIVGSSVYFEELKLKYQKLATNKIIFHGFLSTKEVHEIYKKADFIVLPSKSEGFPKVIAEAMNFGCIPVVTDISCIGQYIKHKKNGFLLNNNSLSEIKYAFNLIENTDRNQLKRMMISNCDLIHLFTYKNYNKRIASDILNR